MVFFRSRTLPFGQSWLFPRLVLLLSFFLLPLPPIFLYGQLRPLSPVTPYLFWVVFLFLLLFSFYVAYALSRRSRRSALPFLVELASPLLWIFVFQSVFLFASHYYIFSVALTRPCDLFFFYFVVVGYAGLFWFIAVDPIFWVDQYTEENIDSARWDECGFSFLTELQEWYVPDYLDRRRRGEQYSYYEFTKYWKVDMRDFQQERFKDGKYYEKKEERADILDVDFYNFGAKPDPLGDPFKHYRHYLRRTYKSGVLRGMSEVEAVEFSAREDF